MASETDLSDFEDENFKPTGQKRSKKKEYQIRAALRAPRQITFPTKALYDQIIDGTINLEPDYQRDVVWPEAKQVGVLDSIMRNFYLPPIIFSVSQESDGTEKRICIDGKQRLTSIQKFMDGEIYIREPDTNAKFWYKTRKPTQERLPRKYRDLFSKKQILCVEYQDLTDNQEREIFKRVQLGVALTPAEKMKAETATERSALITAVENQYLHDPLFLSVPFEHKRGQSYRFTAAAIYFMANPSHRRAVNADHLASWMSDPSSLSPQFIANVHQAFGIMIEMLRRDEGREFLKVLRGTQKVSPVDFVCMMAVIWDWKDVSSEEEMRGWIRAMRDHARETHKDLYWKPQVLDTYLKFMDYVRNNAVDGVGEDKSAMTEYPAPAPAPAPVPPQHHLPPPGFNVPATQSTMSPPTLSTPTAIQQSTSQGLNRLAGVRAAKAGPASAPLPFTPPPSQTQPGPSTAVGAGGVRERSVDGWHVLEENLMDIINNKAAPVPDLNNIDVDTEMRSPVPAPGPWQMVEDRHSHSHSPRRMGSSGSVGARGSMDSSGSRHGHAEERRFHPYASPPPTQVGDRRRDDRRPR
ncbi:uncharacterized protein STEHIDRAFT_125712 [Stereum hirsutum FP-91666 SS1]|uniref:uncharacterized protein n=1 Tax=Stereum hirsutum (strain FP-91666) TaxID=721885 RepID=UPI000444A018|nr:uncharacterized protein STEHIDRAFT_125712 [Stereum hirsutum FP-91666 SS1]EIM80690.1 hypothetical protein STEHIDRAFT_125712 [Stereum hirsutum FP-91666 SS1]